jgi:hypothetical protein
MAVIIAICISADVTVEKVVIGNILSKELPSLHL